MIAVLGGVLTALLVAATVGSMLAASYFRSLAGVNRADQRLSDRPPSSATIRASSPPT